MLAMTVFYFHIRVIRWGKPDRKMGGKLARYLLPQHVDRIRAGHPQ